MYGSGYRIVSLLSNTPTIRAVFAALFNYALKQLQEWHVSPLDCMMLALYYLHAVLPHARNHSAPAWKLPYAHPTSLLHRLFLTRSPTLQMRSLNESKETSTNHQKIPTSTLVQRVFLTYPKGNYHTERERESSKPPYRVTVMCYIMHVQLCFHTNRIQCLAKIITL